MKLVHKSLFMAGIFLSLSLNAQAASFCKDKVSSVIDKLATNVCAQVDTKPLTMEQASQSPYGYKSPDANCDLGLSMPGLPSFGMNIGGLDSCSILKAVTGDLVDKANQEMQGSLDGALNAIKGDTSIPSNVDLNEIVGGQIKSGTGL